MSEILTSGLLSGGKFVSSRSIRDALLAEYVVNGSGLFLTRAVSDDGDRTMKFGSDVGGVMNITERMIKGNRIWAIFFGVSRYFCGELYRNCRNVGKEYPETGKKV